MSSLYWILLFGGLMSIIALVGGLFVLLPERLLERILKPVVSFAAGSLIGGAIFHMLPHAIGEGPAGFSELAGVVAGFAVFFAVDQLLEWHHCHLPPSEHYRPLGPLLLVADGLHNLLGGLAVGAVFLVDTAAGIAAWTAAALHEVPQEMGDFGAIVHAGFSRRRALLWNFVSALTFPLGGVIAWAVDGVVDVRLLVALGCGSFLYIAGADLVPEIKRTERLGSSAIRFAAFVAGASLLGGLSWLS